MKKEYIVPALKFESMNADIDILIVSGGMGNKGDHGDAKSINAPAEEGEATYGNLW